MIMGSTELTLMYCTFLGLVVLVIYLFCKWRNSCKDLDEVEEKVEDKYKILKHDTIIYEGKTLYRIKALKDIPGIKETCSVLKGDLGGYIESDYNLSQHGKCWVWPNAKVYGAAAIRDDAQVFGESRVHGFSRVSDRAIISSGANIYSYAEVFGDAVITGNVDVHGDAAIFGRARINGITHVEIYGNCTIFGEVRVSGTVRICDEAKLMNNFMVEGSMSYDEITVIRGMTDCRAGSIYKDAYIERTKDILTIYPIGSRDDMTTFYKNSKGTISVVCGCFRGTIDEFQAAVMKKHANDSKNRRDYLNAINMAKDMIYNRG